VKFNEAGDPAGVERLGIALEPETDYERRPDGSGGCEDPRVTYVEPLQRYIMSYTAFSPQGPRIALALSKDLFHWTRLGLATYAHWHGIDLSNVDDKDASLFPVAIPNSSGHNELGMLHRPLFPGTRPEEIAIQHASREMDLDHESIWISYCPPALKSSEPEHLGRFTSHHRLATPVSPWERLKIGAGTPPILTRHGWLIVCASGPLAHGVDWALRSRTGCGQRLLLVSAWNPCQIAAENVDGDRSKHQDRANPEAPVTMHTFPIWARFGFTVVATISFMVMLASRHLFSIAASYSPRRAA
jgi:hypothetical protein